MLNTGEMAAVTKFFFGKRIDAPVYRDSIEISTPVGARCGWCNDLIEAGDSGTIHAFADPECGLSTEAAHIECQARGILGSLAHLAGTCECGTGEEEPDLRPWREQGRDVLARFLADPEIFRLNAR